MSAAAVLSMQNGPNLQQNEEYHTSPEFTETSFPVESTPTPTEPLDREDNQEVVKLLINTHLEYQSERIIFTRLNTVYLKRMNLWTL